MPPVIDGITIDKVYVRYDGEVFDIDVSSQAFNGINTKEQLVKKIEKHLGFDNKCFEGFEVSVYRSTNYAMIRPQSKFIC